LNILVCPFCSIADHNTYDFFGLTMLDCPSRGTDSHILAHDLDPDLVSGLRPLWYWEPYDPITRELLDWNLPASLEHDRRYVEQDCSRREADQEWFDTCNAIIRTIQNREMRDAWHQSTEVKYRTIRTLGWIAWEKNRIKKMLGLSH